MIVPTTKQERVCKGMAAIVLVVVVPRGQSQPFQSQQTAPHLAALDVQWLADNMIWTLEHSRRIIYDGKSLVGDEPCGSVNVGRM